MSEEAKSTHPEIPVRHAPVPNFPGYWADVDGGVWSIRSGTLYRMRGHWKNRYPVISLRRDGKLFCKKLHSIILSSFDGSPQPGMECRHLDGNPMNNALENLKWGTRSENARDRVRHGRQFYPHGEKSGMAVRTEAEVIAIRAAYKAGRSQNQIAKEFGIYQQDVSRIVLRKTWKCVE